MSYREFAERMETLGKETGKAAQKIEADFASADQARTRYPNDPVKRARAEADYQEALHARRRWKMDKPFEIEREINAIRAELAAKIADDYAADPAALDAPTLELLKSGILTADEYQRLMNKAADAGNATMMRVIGSYAEREAANMAEKYGMGDLHTKQMRAVSYQGKNVGGGVYLENFDVLAEVINRIVRNPALFDSWDALTREVIEKGFV